MIRMILVADIAEGTEQEALTAIQRMKAEVMPSLNYGITLTRPETFGDLMSLMDEGDRVKRLILARAEERKGQW